MKKFAKITAVALVAILALAVLVACGPTSNPQKALDALKENGYVTAGSAIASNGLTAKVACDAEGVTLGVKSGELIAVITGVKLEEKEKEKDVEGNSVTIYYFSSADVAKTAWEGTKIQEIKKQNENDKNYVIKLSGSMIYMGTKEGVKAAR